MSTFLACCTALGGVCAAYAFAQAIMASALRNWGEDDGET